MLSEVWKRRCRVSSSICILSAFVLAIAFLPAGCTSTSPPQIGSITRADSLLFRGVEGGTDGIDAVTAKAGLVKLREHGLPKGDLEVRIWRGFGLGGLEAAVIHRSADSWSGKHIVVDDRTEPQRVTVSPLKTPASGWQA